MEIILKYNGKVIKITISISKIKNKIATKKNRIENGIRALPRGSNPHSKGLSDSRDLIYILMIQNNLNNIHKNITILKLIIIYLKRKK